VTPRLADERIDTNMQKTIQMPSKKTIQMPSKKDATSSE